MTDTQGWVHHAAVGWDSESESVVPNSESPWLISLVAAPALQSLLTGITCQAYIPHRSVWAGGLEIKVDALTVISTGRC